MTLFSKKVTHCIFTTVLSAALLSGCASGSSSGTAATAASGSSSGVNIVYGLAGTWNSIQPWDGPSTMSCMVDDNLFEPLAKPGDGQLDYRAAKSIDLNDDSTVWTVHLRDDIKWSDGEPMTAHDWEWTFKTWADPDLGSYSTTYMMFLLTGTDDSGVMTDADNFGAKALDDYTLELDFKNPQGLDSFFSWYGFYYRALPEHSFEGMSAAEVPKSDFWKNPVTDGVATVKDEPVLAQTLVLQARDNYYLGKPAWDTLTYTVVTADNAANALLNGDIDTYYNMTDYETLDSLDGQNGLHIEQYDGGADYYELSINNQKFSAKVRKALDLLIDKDAVAQVATYGYGSPIGDPVLNSDYKYKRDVDEAKKLLQEENFDFDQTITIACGTARQNWAAVIQQNWAEAGVKSSIQTGEAATIFAQATNGEVDCCIMGNSMSYNPTVEESTQDPNSSNYSRITDSKYYDLCKEIDAATDDSQKQELVKQYTDLLHEECPYIYLFRVPLTIVESARLNGVKGSTFDTPWTWTVQS